MLTRFLFAELCSSTTVKLLEAFYMYIRPAAVRSLEELLR